MIGLFFFFILIFLFPACSPDSTVSERDIYLISVADDAYISDTSRLKTVISDQASLITELSLIDNIHVYSFTSQRGKRYASSPTGDNPNKSPLFKPYDKSGNTLISPSGGDFYEFRYIPGSEEEENNWNMDDVIETIGSLECDENDLIIFTYSGHGDNNTGAFITNVYSDGENKKWSTTNKEAVLEALLSIPGKKILFLDSCYSGNYVINNTLTTKDTFSGDEHRYKGEDYISALKESSLSREDDYYPSFWIMSSSGKNQTASDSIDEGLPFQSRYGAFTYYLLKALGFNMDENLPGKSSKAVSFYSIYSYIHSSFPSDSLVIQTPRSSLRRLDIRIM